MEDCDDGPEAGSLGPESGPSGSVTLRRPAAGPSGPAAGPSGPETGPSGSVTLERRLIPPQNILLHLRDREIHAPKRGNHLNRTLKFYRSVYPDLTVINVEKPACFLRKFSPNGRYLVAFSAQQSDIEIYEFLGVSAAGNLLRKTADLFCSKVSASTGNSKIRERIFSSLFRLRHVIQVTAGHDQLNRECSVFSEDSRFVLVGSSLSISDDPLLFPRMFDFYRNNESLEPQNVEDFSIHVVDMKSGRLTDTKNFKCDKIHLAHNQGLYLLGSTLAVLSVQHQTIHLYKLVDGILIDLQSIGRCVFDDDEMFLRNSLNSAKFGIGNGDGSFETKSGGGGSVKSPVRRHFEIHAMAEKPVNSLKQRLLSFLYKRARDESESAGTRLPLRKFYQRFEFFKSLRIWKMQLIDESHLLLRYLPEDVLHRITKLDAISQISFFVFYDLTTTEVVGVFENLSETLLNLYENFADYFRNSASRFPCGVSSSHHALNSHDRIKQTVLNARNGGKTEMIRRFLSSLPYSAQSFSSSPYLDVELFSYDEKWCSTLERPKQSCDFPVRFYGRDSSLLKFQMQSGFGSENVLPSSTTAGQKQLVAFVFHPFEPFAITVLRAANREYVVNFHIRYGDCASQP